MLTIKKPGWNVHSVMLIFFPFKIMGYRSIFIICWKREAKVNIQLWLSLKIIDCYPPTGKANIHVPVKMFQLRYPYLEVSYLVASPGLMLISCDEIENHGCIVIVQSCLVGVVTAIMRCRLLSMRVCPGHPYTHIESPDSVILCNSQVRS